MNKKPRVFNSVLTLREQYHKLLPGKESLMTLVSEAEVYEQVYNSNAIENSTLSLEETEKIMLQLELDRYISEREIFEAKNLARVVTYIEKRAKEQELNLEVILLLHKMLITNIRDDIAGRFREDNEFVRVGKYIAPAPDQVIPLLTSMLADYNGSVGENIVKRIARLHLTFEHVHPFVDGNGRIGRAINNYLLIREGYVPINIKFTDRLKYYEAFRNFDLKEDTLVMDEIVALALANSYHKRLAYLKQKKIITLREYARVNNISHSNLINKAHRQTIESFLEHGVWKIGV